MDVLRQRALDRKQGSLFMDFPRGGEIEQGNLYMDVMREGTESKAVFTWTS
jgi:hypothetical protein